MNSLHEIPWPIWGLVLGGVLYPIIARLLLEYAHPRRMRIEELSRQLCRDPKLTQSQKNLIQLSVTMNGRFWPMIAIAFLLPLVIVGMALVPKLRQEKPEDVEIQELLNDSRYEELSDLEIGCLFAANPIIGILVALELAAFVATGAFFLIGFKGMKRIEMRTIEALSQMFHHPSISIRH